MSPTSSASMPASTIALPGSSTTSSGVIAARISGETDESGPSTSTRDGPKTAYADEAGDRRVEPGDRGQARRAPRRPCPAGRGSPRARGRRRGRRATTAAGTSGRRRPPGPIGRATWPGQYAAASNSSTPPTGQGALPSSGESAPCPTRWSEPPQTGPLPREQRDSDATSAAAQWGCDEHLLSDAPRRGNATRGTGRAVARPVPRSARLLTPTL